MSNDSEPLDPLISNVRWFLRPGQKRDASTMPTAPPSKSTSASTESSTVTGAPPSDATRRSDGAGAAPRPPAAVLDERARGRRHRVDLADQVAGEVDHVR